MDFIILWLPLRRHTEVNRTLLKNNGSSVKNMVLYRTKTLNDPCACLDGSLHSEMVLQIDGECLVCGSV